MENSLQVCDVHLERFIVHAFGNVYLGSVNAGLEEAGHDPNISWDFHMVYHHLCFKVCASCLCGCPEIYQVSIKLQNIVTKYRYEHMSFFCSYVRLRGILDPTPLSAAREICIPRRKTSFR